MAEPGPRRSTARLVRLLGARTSGRLALGALLLLAASAIYAPLLANDRPYWLHAADYGSYARAHRILRVEGRSWLGDFVEDAARLATLEHQVRRLRPSLGGEHRDLLEELLASARSLDRARFEGSLARIEGELRAGDPEDAASGLRLEPSWSFPLAASLGPGSVFSMALFSWGLWRLLLRRPPGAAALATAGFFSVGLAFAWGSLFGPRPSTDFAPYKEGAAAGSLLVESALFPPLPMGYAETNLSERFRAPSWHASARRPAAQVEGGPGPGLRRELPPVEVRPFEPAVDSLRRHPLGTDSLGRDLLARLLWGGRTSLLVGVASTLLLLLLGVPLGAWAGYFGGLPDALVLRGIEVLQSIPALFAVLAATALVPEERLHPLFTMVLLIALIRWTGVARLVRGECLRLRNEGFVESARAVGLSEGRVLCAHVLPNALGPVWVAAAFSVAAGVLFESAISFLGFGIRHPVPSWGALLNDTRALEYWWVHLFPGLAIFATALAANTLGESLRDAFDPR